MKKKNQNNQPGSILKRDFFFNNATRANGKPRRLFRLKISQVQTGGRFFFITESKDRTSSFKTTLQNLLYSLNFEKRVVNPIFTYYTGVEVAWSNFELVNFRQIQTR